MPPERLEQMRTTARLFPQSDVRLLLDEVDRLTRLARDNARTASMLAFRMKSYADDIARYEGLSSVRASMLRDARLDQIECAAPVEDRDHHEH